MTAQEIFDTVVRHLHTQGKMACDHDLGCRYRTDDGLRCAVGCLIKDDEYDPAMEGKDIDTLLYDNHLPHLFPHEELLYSLQHTHDTGHVWNSNELMGKALLRVANTHGLNPAIVKELYDVS